VAGPKREGGVCTLVRDFLSRALVATTVHHRRQRFSFERRFLLLVPAGKAAGITASSASARAPALGRAIPHEQGPSARERPVQLDSAVCSENGWRGPEHSGRRGSRCEDFRELYSRNFDASVGSAVDVLVLDARTATLVGDSGYG